MLSLPIQSYSLLDCWFGDCYCQRLQVHRGRSRARSPVVARCVWCGQGQMDLCRVGYPYPTGSGGLLVQLGGARVCDNSAGSDLAANVLPSDALAARSHRKRCQVPGIVTALSGVWHFGHGPVHWTS